MHRRSSRRVLLLAGLIGLLTTGSIAPAASIAEGEPRPDETLASDLDALFESTFDAFLDLDPSYAARIGDRRAPGRLTVDLTAESLRAQRELLDAASARLAVLLSDAEALETLDDRHRTWADAFAHLLATRRALLDQPLHLLPLAPSMDLPARFAQIASGDADLRFERAEDFEHYLARVDDLERWIDAAIHNLDEGVRRGITHPRPIALAEIHALDRLLDGADDPSRSIFASPLRALDALPDLPADQSADLRRRLAETTRDRILPAILSLREHLAQRYLPQARTELGLASMAGGPEIYRAWVRYFTTTDLSPDEIFALGEREVERIGRAQRLLERSSDGSSRGDGWIAADRVVGHFEGLRDQIAGRLERIFPFVPESPLVIRHVEAHNAGTGGAFYEGPSADGARPGTFWVRRGGFSAGEAEVLFLHEGLPGHHFQIAFVQEQRDLPRFLRFGYVGAYVEGWGLYAETLGRELDLGRSTAADLARLRYERGRAGRLLGDVGLHHLGWSEDDARKRLLRRDLGWPAGELQRYATLPGQGLSYTLGQQTILALRARAEKALGRDFDLADFHRVVLEDGPLPLPVLEAKVDRWLAGS